MFLKPGALLGSTVVIVILWVLLLMVFSDIKDILGHLGDSFIDKHYCRHLGQLGVLLALPHDESLT